MSKNLSQTYLLLTTKPTNLRTPPNLQFLTISLVNCQVENNNPCEDDTFTTIFLRTV